MAARLIKTNTSNAFSTSLNGSVASGDTSILLTSTAGLVAPGVLCIDRIDSNGTATPVIREYVSFTGISTNTLTGVTRALAGSTAQAHSSGAVVEENFSVTHWGDLVDFLAVSHDSAGKLVTSTATITTATITTSTVATETVTNLIVTNSLYASGASITGQFPIHPVWVIGGAVSLATTSVGKPLPMPQNGTLSFFSAVLRTPASGASLIIDINKNGTSIFTNQATRLLIVGAGTFISTASIGTKTFNAGDIFTVDIDAGGGSGSDLTILGKAL